MLLFGILLCTWSRFSTADIPTYQMEENCGNDISMILDSVYQLNIRLDDTFLADNSLKTPSQSTCKTRIEPWYTWPNLMFYFESLDLDCSLGYLQFFQSIANETKVNGLEEDVCGDQKPRGVFTLDTNSFLTIVYVPRQTQYIEDAVSIIVTAYAQDECPVHGFRCDNSRCIDRDIRCDGYNSCGDGSGCKFDLSSIAIAGIIISSGVGLFVLVSIAICVVCCLKKRKTIHNNIQNQSDQIVVYTATQSNVSLSGAPFYNTGQCAQPSSNVCSSTNQSGTGLSQFQGPPVSVTAGQKPAYPANWSMPPSYQQQNYYRNPPPYEEIRGATTVDTDRDNEETNKPSNAPGAAVRDESEYANDVNEPEENYAHGNENNYEEIHCNPNNEIDSSDNGNTSDKDLSDNINRPEACENKGNHDDSPENLENCENENRTNS